MQQMNDQTMHRAAAPDETGYYMPQTPAPDNDTWVYGTPGQLQNASAEINAGAELSPLAAVLYFTVSVPIQGMNGGERLGGISSAAAQSQRMKNPVDMANTHMPADSEIAYQASLRSLLDRNTGYFVVATFQVGPNQPVTWQGILHSVGSDYVVIYQPDYERYISGDLYSLKFVQFHNVKGIPYCAASQSWQGV
ncbi:MAG: hypothetical protein K2P04_02575 [Oscillospiraceae bacterium]|nr:hypothetical protein [Oscillospiraceae bacterium]